METTFEHYFNKTNESWERYREKYLIDNPDKKKVPQAERDRFYQAYMNYSLLKVTWFLAIVTIILSCLTLFLQSLK